jgi:hypothetical protein
MLRATLSGRGDTPLDFKPGSACRRMSSAECEEVRKQRSRKCICALFWGRIAPGQWDGFEAAYKKVVLEHVERANDAVKNFRDNVVSADGRAEFLRYQRLPLTHCGAAGVDIGTSRTLAARRSHAVMARLTNQK